MAIFQNWTTKSNQIYGTLSIHRSSMKTFYKIPGEVSGVSGICHKGFKTYKMGLW